MKTWRQMTGKEKGAACAALYPRLTYAQIAHALGASRSAVAGALDRYRRPEESAAKLAAFRVARRAKRGRSPYWEEVALTETWAERKARRAREKENCRGSTDTHATP